MAWQIFRVACALAWLIIAFHIFRGTADNVDTIFGGLACVVVALGILNEMRNKTGKAQ